MRRWLLGPLGVGPLAVLAAYLYGFNRGEWLGELRGTLKTNATWSRAMLGRPEPIEPRRRRWWR